MLHQQKGAGVLLFREPKTQERYHEYLKKKNPEECYLCVAPALKEFAFWRLLVDSFPYDRIAKTHHLLTPRRHANEHELTPAEYTELYAIKLLMENDYDTFLENTERLRSIPGHFHVHAIKLIDAVN